MSSVRKNLPGLIGASVKFEVIFDVDKKEKEIKQLEAKAARQDFWSNPQEAQVCTKRLNELRGEIGRWYELSKQADEQAGLIELAEEAKEDSYLEEADRLVKNLLEEVAYLEQVKYLSGEFDRNNAIFGIHAGAGGTESCDWAQMLLRMYGRWVEKKGLSLHITEILQGEEAGLKSVTTLVSGEFAYGYLRGERGIHRLVRISPFDANKRRHTSFSSVDVIPEVNEKISVDVKDAELRVDTYRASGAGGQHVNKTDSAVRITHIPTGIVAQSQNERSQFQNRATAMRILKSRLFEHLREKKERELSEKMGEKAKIGWGSQIRSYVFQPYSMVKDHRTGVETGNIQAVMNGEIDSFIEAYLKRGSTL